MTICWTRRQEPQCRKLPQHPISHFREMKPLEAVSMHSYKGSKFTVYDLQVPEWKGVGWGWGWGCGLSQWRVVLHPRSWEQGTENRAVSTYYVRGGWAKLQLECLFQKDPREKQTRNTGEGNLSLGLSECPELGCHTAKCLGSNSQQLLSHHTDCISDWGGLHPQSSQVAPRGNSPSCLVLYKCPARLGSGFSLCLTSLFLWASV